MDNPQQGITPQNPDDSFSIRKRFPGEASASPPPAQPPAPSRRGLFSRVLLPLIVFVLVIGGVAWVTQYMPNRKTENDATGGPKLPVTEELLINFDEITSVWDPRDKTFAKEFEHNDSGTYDFKFANSTDETIFLGAYYVSCTCSKLKVATFADKEPSDLEKLWQPLLADAKFDTKQTVTIPAKSRGIVRVSWNPGRLTDPLSKIKIQLWMQPEKRAGVRQVQELTTVVRIVPRIMFEPQIAKIGELGNRGAARSEVELWSATRSDIVDLKLEPETENELIDIQLSRMNKEDQDKLQARLKSKINTQVQAAWRAQITVYEQNGKRQLPQGPFRQQLQVIADGEKGNGPRLEGFVPGEVRVGPASDAGVFKLDRFLARNGAKKPVTLWTDKSVGLELDSYRPGYIKVHLTEDPKGSTANQRRWVLEVEVPAKGPVGALPEDSAIILKTQSASPRQIYIPLRGSATPG